MYVYVYVFPLFRVFLPQDFEFLKTESWRVLNEIAYVSGFGGLCFGFGQFYSPT